MVATQADAAKLFRESAYPDLVTNHLPPPNVAPATVNQEMAVAARRAFEEAFGKGGERIMHMDGR